MFSASTLINEIDINPPGRSDNRYMYVELEGTPGASLNNDYFVAFQSGGNAEFVQSLSGYSIGSDGLAVIKNTTGGFSIPAATTVIPNNTFFTSDGDSGFTQDTLSFYLYSSPNNPFVQGTDYDQNNDGILDHLPSGASVLDHIAVLENSGDLTYGGDVIQDLDGGGAPDAVTRFYGDTTLTTASWFGGELNDTGNVASTTLYDVTRPGTNMINGSYITPGTSNYPGPSSPSIAVKNPNPTFTVASPANSAVIVDSGLTVTSNDANITGATMSIQSYQSGDQLNYTTIDGVTMSSGVPSGGNLTYTFSGNVPAASYQAALRTVSFSTTSTTTGTRSIDVQADDTNAS
ncbi:MAG TPA: hypothetical protein VMF30_03100, partial [Pirellulales bacterium]|nr:hypothetical protein [Pirellulales bacterium]